MSKLPLPVASDVEFVEPDNGILFTYANNVQLGYTAFDARFVFGEVVDFKSGKTTVEQRVQVTMSWLQVKLMHYFMDMLLTQHEKAFGPISIPEPMKEFKPR